MKFKAIVGIKNQPSLTGPLQAIDIHDAIYRLTNLLKQSHAPHVITSIHVCPVPDNQAVLTSSTWEHFTKGA